MRQNCGTSDKKFLRGRYRSLKEITAIGEIDSRFQSENMTLPILQQAKYFAEELTKRCPSDSLEKFSATLLDAKVDLNPHQVDAALFAFRSPLSQGAILADEVGLGKTIEAGILLSQKWAEGNRRLVVVCPSNLRKQWSQELEEKFFLPTIILESKNFRVFQKNGQTNPFEQKEVVICSFHFASQRAEFLQLSSWDLAVIDEAHRLRNAHQPANILGKSIRDALRGTKKVLLTATPLQNSLMELFGLVGFIDERIFGDRTSFRAQFARPGSDEGFADLKDRIAPVCHRTLRRQVQEYVKYTRRKPATIQFEPSESEQLLYEKINEFLRKDSLFALPDRQRHLITMIMRKLLASSSFAIAGTLRQLISRLEKMAETATEQLDGGENFDTDLDDLDDYLDEYEYEEAQESRSLTAQELEKIRLEIEEIAGYRDLAEAIDSNAKGEKLIAALTEGFAQFSKIGVPQKAVVFTESRRTQRYLFDLLEKTAFSGKTALFNGDNHDDLSKNIYQNWLSKNAGTDRVSGSSSADMRAAIVEHFRDGAQILIATEAAAEGINLQFCSMVVNYDLPWNPQRIEQRIGRCHRYGQKNDVVVVNFLNILNAADQRVFQLLEQKFQLFEGVFGASDEVLGAIESGVDFEKKIAEIVQTCRTAEEINAAFDDMQRELETQIEDKMRQTRDRLFEHFDADVIDKLRIRMADAQTYIGKYEQWLWWLSLFSLHGVATFDHAHFKFFLKKTPVFSPETEEGWYSIDKKMVADHRLRLGHPLAQAMISMVKNEPAPPAEITFDRSAAAAKSAALDVFAGQSGWLALHKITVEALETADHLVFTAFSENGQPLDDELCRRLFALPAVSRSLSEAETPVAVQNWLDIAFQKQKSALFDTSKSRDLEHYKTESEKLRRWADDRVLAARKEMHDAKDKIRDLENQIKLETDLPKILEMQTKIRDLEKKLRSLRRGIDEAEDQIHENRDALIREIELKLAQKTSEQHIFSIRWKLV